MILYDLKKILRATKGNARKIVLALRVLSGEVPKNYYDPLYFFYQKDLTGNSFLVNPREVLDQDFFYKPKEIAEYLALASFRNYSHFLTTGDTRLDLFHSPVSEKIITNNRLLYIKDGFVHFKYEEVTTEN